MAATGAAWQPDGVPTGLAKRAEILRNAALAYTRGEITLLQYLDVVRSFRKR